MLRFSVSILLVIACLVGFSQKPTDDVILNKFKPEFFASLLQKKVNDYRVANDVEPLEIDETFLKLEPRRFGDTY